MTQSEVHNPTDEEEDMTQSEVQSSNVLDYG
jgi:hypothetical protein